MLDISYVKIRIGMVSRGLFFKSSGTNSYGKKILAYKGSWDSHFFTSLFTWKKVQIPQNKTQWEDDAFGFQES